MSSAPTMPPDVAAVFDGYPEAARKRLGTVRAAIFDLAEELEVGPLTEALRWGEPAYLTQATKAGSTVRLGWSARDADAVKVLLICTTGLVDGMRERFGTELSFEGNRAIRLPLGETVPDFALRACLAEALTYHRRRRGDRR